MQNSHVWQAEITSFVSHWYLLIKIFNNNKYILVREWEYVISFKHYNFNKQANVNIEL